MKDRTFLLMLLVGLVFSCKKEKQLVTQKGLAGWELADSIEKSITIPKFPDRQFTILDYGAKDSVGFNNSAPIAKAIEECPKAGGGKVIIPEGIFFAHILSCLNSGKYTKLWVITDIQ